MQRRSPQYIYGLFHPETNELRYIGKTGNLRKRYNQHIGTAYRNTNTFVARWIKGLLNAGLRPDIRVIETVVTGDWAEREQFWIAHYRSQGYRLTNLTEGGEGAAGWVPPPDWRKRQGMKSKTNWQTPGFRARWIAIRTLGPERWSRHYVCCVECGRTDLRHAHEGKCITCYHREKHRRLHQPDRPYHEWSRDHACCLECGTTERPHKGRGLCTNCFARRRTSLKPAQPPRWAREHDHCISCGLTDRPHQGNGLCKRCHGRERYRTANNVPRERRR